MPEGPAAAWTQVAPSATGNTTPEQSKQAPGYSVLHRVYDTMEEPSSSTLAQTIASFILLCIVVSIAALILESDPKIKQPYGHIFSSVEIVTTAVFTLEYIIRLLVCTQKPDRPHADSVGTTIRKFITAPTNLIDLCAIVPFYVEYFFKGGDVKFLKVLRAIRLVRLFRVFKVGKFAAGVRVMAEAISNSRHALNTLVFFVAVAMILFSSAVYYAEKLMCPMFDSSEASQLEFVRYEEECRLGLPSQHICCDYACNPANPGVVDYPQSLEGYQALGERFEPPSNASVVEVVRNFPNTLCVYSMTDEEWREARDETDDRGLSEGELESSFIVMVVSSNTYKSIPHSFWWSIVSMTTTGFGDEVPETIVGKFFAIIAMCFGILLIALPVAIVGSKFQEAFAQMENEQRLQREGRAERVRRSLTRIGIGKENTDPAPVMPEESPRVEVPPEKLIDAEEFATSFFPQLAHLVQEVPEGHPAHATVDRVARSYEELASVQAQIFATQMVLVQNQQALGVDMGALLGSSSTAENEPPKRIVNPKPDPI